MSIELKNISKTYADKRVLNAIDLRIEQGHLLALLGPSGSGKTTLLRIMAGLEQADQGRILLHGKDVTTLPVRDRRVGFVFQQYALFRNMSIFENVAFGMRIQPYKMRPSKADINKEAMRLLELVGVDQHAKKYPDQISGGQKQRVALARALATKPEILFLDEPFAALDAQVRTELKRWLVELHAKVGLTTVFVTHDQSEAMEVADEIVILHNGKIAQKGSPEEIYSNPVNDFVYDFLGNKSTLDIPGKETTVFRPHEVSLSTTATNGDYLAAEITSIRPLGPVIRLQLLPQGALSPVEVEITRQQIPLNILQENTSIWFKPTPSKSSTYRSTNKVNTLYPSHSKQGHNGIPYQQAPQAVVAVQ